MGAINETTKGIWRVLVGEIPVSVLIFVIGIIAHGVISWSKIDTMVSAVRELTIEVRDHSAMAGHGVAINNIVELKQRVLGLEKRERELLNKLASHKGD